MARKLHKSYVAYIQGAKKMDVGHDKIWLRERRCSFSASDSAEARIIVRSHRSLRDQLGSRATGCRRWQRT